MAKASLIWMRAQAVLAMLVLTLVAFGPSVDQVVCGSEWSDKAVATESVADAPAVSSSQENHKSTHVGHPAGVCSHGHCHHATTALAAGDLAADGPEIALDRRSPIRSSPSVGDLKFGLKRPPRA